MKLFSVLSLSSAHAALTLSRREATQSDLNQAVEESAENDVVGIESMMKFYNPTILPYLTNYGCTGRGYFNYAAPPAGQPQDPVDKAFLWWKKCLQCAKGEYDVKEFSYNPTDSFYQFDSENKLCTSDSGSFHRAVCECDHSFAKILFDTENTAKESGLSAKSDTSDCLPFEHHHVNSRCCFNERGGTFHMYNHNHKCCEDGEVRDIGTCGN